MGFDEDLARQRRFERLKAAAKATDGLGFESGDIECNEWEELELASRIWQAQLWIDAEYKRQEIER